jgi:hypothetical protein
MRPVLLLLYAYLPEHYKNSKGSRRKVLGKIWGVLTKMNFRMLIKSVKKVSLSTLIELKKYKK